MPLTVEKTQRSIRPNAQPLRRRDVPPLENGDHLTQPEFHRRYAAMPDARAELVAGIVYRSPAPRVEHSEALSAATGWLVAYEAATFGTQTLSKQTVILDIATEVQPDVMLTVLPAFGGRAVVKNGYLTQAPELVLEIANTTASIDLNAKFVSYRQNNAQEYLVHLAREKTVKWFSLRDGNYELMTPDAKGILRSAVFPGLWLNVKALIKRDLNALFRTLNAGLATPEHTAFCERLRATAALLKKTRKR